MSASAGVPEFEIGSERGPHDVCVVRVAGEADLSHERELRAALGRAIDDGEKRIVVDLTRCEFIDSTGVRALLVSHGRQEDHGQGAGRLAIATSNGQVLRVLSVMGVGRAIEIHPTVEEAAAALSG
jgi:anti-sigma B factor antagonist